MSNKLINLENITKIFDGVTVLDNLNLYIRENEFLTLLGPAAAGRRRCCGSWEGSKTLTKGVCSSTAEISRNCRPTNAS